MITENTFNCLIGHNCSSPKSLLKATSFFWFYFDLFRRSSVCTRPPHLQCERDLRKPGVERTPELRRSPGPDLQRGVQTLWTGRPTMSALRQRHPLQPAAAEPERNQGVHQRAAGPHQLHLRGVGGQRSVPSEPGA